MIGLDAGAAWSSVPVGRATVRAVFSRAIHVDVAGSGPMVIADAAVPPGPLHLRVNPLPVVAEGATVLIEDGRLRLATSSLDLRLVPTWTPPPCGGPLRSHPVPGTERSALAGRSALLERVRRLLAHDDVDGVARHLGGLGPGLTPAGDDALAGIVLTLHVSGVDERRLRAVVELVRSTTLSLAYLRWAARGQCIEPAHRLLAALTGTDPEPVAAAASRLARHGASSGADLLLGVGCALATAAVRTAGEPATRP
jgi:hypothetical protein